jgi:hypothetical protein
MFEADVRGDGPGERALAARSLHGDRTGATGRVALSARAGALEVSGGATPSCCPPIGHRQEADPTGKSGLDHGLRCRMRTCASLSAGYGVVLAEVLIRLGIPVRRPLVRVVYIRRRASRLCSRFGSAGDGMARASKLAMGNAGSRRGIEPFGLSSCSDIPVMQPTEAALEHSMARQFGPGRAGSAGRASQRGEA